MKFIKLNVVNGNEILLNARKIVAIYEMRDHRLDNKNSTTIVFDGEVYLGNKQVSVCESISIIEELLNEN